MQIHRWVFHISSISYKVSRGYIISGENKQTTEESFLCSGIVLRMTNRYHLGLWGVIALPRCVLYDREKNGMFPRRRFRKINPVPRRDAKRVSESHLLGRGAPGLFGLSRPACVLQRRANVCCCASTGLRLCSRVLSPDPAKWQIQRNWKKDWRGAREACETKCKSKWRRRKVESGSERNDEGVKRRKKLCTFLRGSK